MILDNINNKWHSALMCMASIMRPLDLYELRDIFNKIPQYRYNDVYLFVKEMRNNSVLKIEDTNTSYTGIYSIAPQYICSLLKNISDSDFLIYQSFELKQINVKDFVATLRDYVLKRKYASSVFDESEYVSLRFALISDVLRYLRRDDKFLNFFTNMSADMLIPMFEEDTVSLVNLAPVHKRDYFEKIYFNNDKLDENIRNYCFDKFLVYYDFLTTGNIVECVPKASNSFYGHLLLAISFVYKGEYKDALNLFQSLLKLESDSILKDAFASFIYIHALISDNSASSLRRLKALNNNRKIKDHINFIPALMMIQIALTGECHDLYIYEMISSDNKMLKILGALVIQHYGIEIPDKSWVNKIEKMVAASDYTVMKLEYSQDFPSLQNQSDQFRELTGLHPLLPPYRETEMWEHIIDSMMTMAYDTSSSSLSKDKEEISRISYLINSYFNITPRLQKSKDGGVTWSKGRNIAMTKFKEGLPEMSDFDLRMIAHVKILERSWNGAVTYGIFGERAVTELIGSQVVFMEENPSLRIDISEEKPQLIVTKTSSGYIVMNNVCKGELTKQNFVRIDTPQAYKVIRINNHQRDIFNNFNRLKEFPIEAKGKLTQLLTLLSKDVIVLSDLLKGSENIDRVDGNSLITVQLRPMGDIIMAQLYVKPLDKGTVYCSPAKGMEYIATSINGNSVQVVRNLIREKTNLDVVLSFMSEFEESEGNNKWNLNTVECLLLLDKLRDMNNYCCVEWPEGVKFKVSHHVIKPDNLHLSVSGMGQWFEVNGEVRLSDKTIIRIADILQKLHEGNGNFIRLDGNEYIALTEQMRRQLIMLDRLADTNKKNMRLSSFNVSFLEDLKGAGVDMKSDETYNNLIKRISDSENKVYNVPNNIQADLRSYQRDGYVWMAQLAEWGAGACLADDMGLGKTLQAITLMLSRAKIGTSLVVAPTSLLINWQEEIRKFAPELNTFILNNAGEDRKKIIDESSAYDIIITTYGLLITEEKLICSRTWNMIVLDEAHTIKNRETKMSKAAMNLRGDFRLLLTGTPLQNHLSEIWNLFQFANPGLLGTFTQFTDRFINPIEKNRDKERQKLLNRVISPFILRRTKSEVLTELPEKTEVTLNVELSHEEWALYESIRRQALMNMEDSGASAVQALAEITRLRQAACHPALVDKSLDIPSSKSEAFMNIVDDLISNHHRALVFSQFTSHLDLIRRELDDADINYLYLDGSVGFARRIELVADFQKGDMPLFLISLKAGGLGLNLTAADYIIHLDPWWNPAIEDQASDRAYRIGQKRPVTVYRLIAKNTIEEKIIDLHNTKKDLANALLEGSDMTQKMTRDELLLMLKDEL